MSLESLLRKPLKTLPSDASCQDAALLMRDANIGCVVVVAENERPLGILTDRDLVLQIVAKGRDGKQVCVADVMSSEPIFLSLDRELSDVVHVMRDLAVRRLPVVDEEGRALGIVALDDVLLLLADQLGDLAGAVRSELAGK